MNDADRHDQIEKLAELKRVLDDQGADELDIRDAATRAVNAFDGSIAEHARWRPYSRRGSSDPEIRREAARLAQVYQVGPLFCRFWLNFGISTPVSC